MPQNSPDNKNGKRRSSKKLWLQRTGELEDTAVYFAVIITTYYFFFFRSCCLLRSVCVFANVLLFESMMAYHHYTFIFRIPSYRAYQMQGRQRGFQCQSNFSQEQARSPSKLRKFMRIWCKTTLRRVGNQQCEVRPSSTNHLICINPQCVDEDE